MKLKNLTMMRIDGNLTFEGRLKSYDHPDENLIVSRAQLEDQMNKIYIKNTKKYLGYYVDPYYENKFSNLSKAAFFISNVWFDDIGMYGTLTIDSKLPAGRQLEEAVFNANITNNLDVTLNTCGYGTITFRDGTRFGVDENFKLAGFYFSISPKEADDLVCEM